MWGHEHIDEVVQELDQLVRNLNSEADSRSVVIVEGKRDLAALRSLGFRGEAVMLCHNGSISGLAENVSRYRKTILLLDLDKEGRSLTAKAASLLQGRTTIDLSYRRKLGLIGKGRIRHVEELSRFREYLA